MAVAILGGDANWIAVDKPAGMVVIPARGEPPEACLARTLERELDRRLWVVHRIDRDTSGVVLFATNSQAHRFLSMAFEQGKVDKTYLAFTRGAPPKKRGRIDVPLHPARKGKMRPAGPAEQGALKAVTEYELLHTWSLPSGDIALVELHPRTGRHHQIRVHLRSIGIPLLVDPAYGRTDQVTQTELGGSEEAVICSRTTLHASLVEFRSPTTGEPVLVRSPLPSDLCRLRAVLDRTATR
ncbi:MAG: RluA family pseudouridine synthase [Bradymonadales bacterium]|nr:RluA family pseudouridine synthase [Bradymonadales bacterium]